MLVYISAEQTLKNALDELGSGGIAKTRRQTVSDALNKLGQRPEARRAQMRAYIVSQTDSDSDIEGPSARAVKGPYRGPP